MDDGWVNRASGSRDGRTGGEWETAPQASESLEDGLIDDQATGHNQLFAEVVRRQ